MQTLQESFFLPKIFFCLKGRVIEEGRDRDLLPLAAMARTVSGQSQEPGTPLSLPHGWRGSSTRAMLPCSPWCMSRELECKQRCWDSIVLTPWILCEMTVVEFQCNPLAFQAKLCLLLSLAVLPLRISLFAPELWSRVNARSQNTKWVTLIGQKTHFGQTHDAPMTRIDRFRC